MRRTHTEIKTIPVWTFRIFVIFKMCVKCKSKVRSVRAQKDFEWDNMSSGGSRKNSRNVNFL